MTVVLCALTGFGNAVLEALLSDTRVRVGAVFTHRYDAPFPYYAERQLIDLCAARGVPCHYDATVGSDAGLARLRAVAPDLILMATFKQILGPSVLGLPPLGVVNLHPSLLPRHRGPCPTQAALLSDDSTSGVTAHYVTTGVDDGDILLQRAIPIGEVANDGALRQQLASLAAAMIPDLFALWEHGGRPAGRPQDASLATLAQRLTPEDGFLERLSTAEAIRRAVRALNPLPGTSIAIDGERMAVDRCVVLPGPGRRRPRVTPEVVELAMGDATVCLHRTPR